MKKWTGNGRILELGLLTASLMALAPSPAWTQPARNSAPAATAAPAAPITVEQPDANRTRDELTRLLEHYPPTLRNVFATDQSKLKMRGARSKFLGLLPNVPGAASANAAVLNHALINCACGRSVER